MGRHRVRCQKGRYEKLGSDLWAEQILMDIKLRAALEKHLDDLRSHPPFEDVRLK